MSFFKKVAGVFVELDEKPQPKEGDMSMDELERLLASTPSPKKEAPKQEAPRPSQEGPPPPVTPVGKRPLDYTLEDVYERAALPRGKNTATAIAKILQGLADFPPDHQLQMVRAMDKVDDEWDENSIVADARRRMTVLDQFHQQLDRDVLARTQEISNTFQDAQRELQQNVADLTRQIEALEARRDEMQGRLDSHQMRAQAAVLHAEESRDTLRERIRRARDEMQQIIDFFN